MILISRMVLAVILILNICILTWRAIKVESLDKPKPALSSLSRSKNIEDSKIPLHSFIKHDSNFEHPNYAGKHLLADIQYGNESTAHEYPTLSSEQNMKFKSPTANDKLIDLPDFKFTMQQAACAPQTEALIVVHSAPQNHEKRRIIRDTWGNIEVLRKTPLRLIFLFGITQPSELQQQLDRENALFADIVQGAFVDNYRNLTYKHVMALKWFLANCAHAQLLIKVDDDIFVNSPLLIDYATGKKDIESEQFKITIPTTKASFSNKQFQPSTDLFNRPRNLLFCDHYLYSMVKRSFRSKWRVSIREYPKSYYPPYCPGYAIIYSKDVVDRLYIAAQHAKYFWIDDVHITGVLAQLQGINITSFVDYILHKEQFELILQDHAKIKDMEFLFSSHSIASEKIPSLWKIYVHQQQDTTIVPYVDQRTKRSIANKLKKSATATERLRSTISATEKNQAKKINHKMPSTAVEKDPLLDKSR